MLRSLAEDQEDVWQQAFASQHLGNESQRFDFHTPTEIKKDLDAMLLEADKIESYVSCPPLGSRHYLADSKYRSMPFSTYDRQNSADYKRKTRPNSPTSFSFLRS